MDGFVSPAVWGPDTWSALAHIACGFDPARKDYYRMFFNTVPFVLRCDECNQNCQAIVARRPVEPFLTSPRRLLEWVYLTHRDVRGHQHVKSTPDYTFEDMLRRYLPSDTQPAETAEAIDDNHPVARATTGRIEGFVSRPETAYNVRDSGRSAPRECADSHDVRGGRAPAHQSPNQTFPGQPAGAAPIKTAVILNTSAPAGRAAMASVGYNAWGAQHTRASFGMVAPQNGAKQSESATSAVKGLSRCCKGRSQMNTGMGMSFVV